MDMVPVIDFEIDAYTEDGEVFIALEIFSSHHDQGRIFKLINDTSMERFVETAILQLEVEYGHQIHIEDRSMLVRLLNEFHRMEWSTDAHLDVPSRTLEFGPSIDTRSYSITALCTAIAPESIALYRLVACTYINAICSDLVDTYAGFIDSELFSENTEGDFEMTLRIHPSINDKIVREFFETQRTSILYSRAYNRLIESLQDVQNMELPPSNDIVYKGMHIKMDAQLWKEAATEKAFQEIASAIDIRLNSLN